MKYFVEFWQEEDGIGVVEIILILVVLIALVLLFKDKITGVVEKAFQTFDADSGSIIGNDKEK
ncbi:MAG: holin, BlyA family protein [Roseburia sp.]|nr:holin, BlyA family protein [Roseburia sp.]